LPAETVVAQPEPVSPSADYRWNAWAFGLDMAWFAIGSSFISGTTVLPSLVASLTDSEVIIGLSSGISSGAWLLPQLFVAGAVAGMAKKKPIVVRFAWASRPIMLLIALALALVGGDAPGWTLAALLGGIFAFYVCDAIVSVPWFDLLGKAIPARRRGRVLGLSQVFGGLAGIGVGIIVRYVLSDRCNIPFAQNYALLYALAGLCFLVSAVTLMFIREPENDSPPQSKPSLREVFASMPGIVAKDRAFVWLMATKTVHGFVVIASAFYVLYGTRYLGFSLADTGLFVSAQVAGSLAAGLLMGIIQDRWGPLVHVRLVMILSATSPLLALLARPLFPALGSGLLYYYALVFFCLGVSFGNIGFPYFNYLLEHAPEDQRPIYLGMLNTLGAVCMVAPPIGGWIVAQVSYEAVFAMAAAFAAVAFLLSQSLPTTRGGSRA